MRFILIRHQKLSHNTGENKLLMKSKKLNGQNLLMKKQYQLMVNHVELAANIGTPEDLEGVINNGGEGIGLYRTEFLIYGSR